ncbi:hypothetical protein [Halomonas sp. THAF5a]|uniref:hypothetical protein n=1 Tax=Halomonas sp. THAF5a TaxID=2587844 RepID=UPI0020A66045|nr:hypothetical protein [Halomonas sp. THAF5a]
MTAPENGSAIGHRRRCSWENTQEPWIPQVMRLLLEFRIESEDEAGNHRRAADFFDEHKLHDPMIRADVTKAMQQPADVILFNIDSKASFNDGGNPIFNV